MGDEGSREDYEQELIQLWRDFSEEVFFAGFETLRPTVIHAFAEWIAQRAGSEAWEKYRAWHRDDSTE